MNNPKVILYSTSLHTWEVWREGRPLGHGSLAACQRAHPDAIGPSQRQRDLEAGDPDAPVAPRY